MCGNPTVLRLICKPSAAGRHTSAPAASDSNPIAPTEDTQRVGQHVGSIPPPPEVVKNPLVQAGDHVATSPLRTEVWVV